MSDQCPYVCECVFRSGCALAPTGLSFLPEGVGEGKLSGYVEPYQNHPCQCLGVGETQEQRVSLVVQVLMFWGHGCIRRGKQRGERSDLAPMGGRGGQEPHLYPRETID